MSKDYRSGPEPRAVTVGDTEKAVRVIVPANIAGDLKKMEGLLTGLAIRLGCPTCISGRNCIFELEREFVLDVGGTLRGHGDLGGAP